MSPYLNRMRGGLYYCVLLAEFPALVLTLFGPPSLSNLIVLNDPYARGRPETEKAVRQGSVFLQVRKPEICDRTVDLLNHNPGDLMCRRNLKQDLRDSVVHPL